MVVMVVRMMMMRETMKQYKTSINILDTMVRIRMLLMTMAPMRIKRMLRMVKYSHTEIQS